jgi:hypothetical protein
LPDEFLPERSLFRRLRHRMNGIPLKSSKNNSELESSSERNYKKVFSEN